MRTLSAILLIAVSECAIASDPQESDAKRYVTHTYGPVAAGRSAFGAGVAQAEDTPHEWGQGAVGFGRRFATSPSAIARPPKSDSSPGCCTRSRQL